MIYFHVNPFKIKIILAIFKKIFEQISCRYVIKFLDEKLLFGFLIIFKNKNLVFYF